MDYLGGLNQNQQSAVKHTEGPLLILAGAGSGKTKTITARLAYLIEVLGVDPSSTLTLTFTNKAATEMKHRALSMIDNNNSLPPLLCTFHKFGLMFLKFHISKLGRENNFIIIDNDDRRKIIKSIKNNDLSHSLILNEISKYKNSLITPKIAKDRSELKIYKQISEVYEKYQEYIESNNLVDFDDLIALTYLILEQDEEVCKETSQKYQYIMVDEYQDTNDLQYKLLKKLTSTHQNLCVVGDDDQSIYGWRGANIKNILEFSDSFDDVKIVKLEKNYRSTKQILDIANNLINHNSGRVGKVLESVKGDGNDISIIASANESTEIAIISKKIKELVDRGVDGNDIAILFRVNALSRSLEEGLSREKIPYKLVGGLKFYERSEIKDLIAYLRLLLHDDDFSIKRVINKPKRGIGKVTIAKLEALASQMQKTFYQTIKNVDKETLSGIIGNKNSSTIKDFVSTIEKLKKEIKKPITFTDYFEKKIAFKTNFKSELNYLDKIANIDEFYANFSDRAKNDESFDIDSFLDEIALQGSQDLAVNSAVSLMSIHASKGLEFDNVFLIGLEEGFFPLIGDDNDLEEERRLAYVAITRAKNDLWFSYVKNRFYKGRREDLGKSRFLSETGLEDGGFKIEKNKIFKKGDIVKHKIFGIGRIQEVTTAGKEFKLKINFGGSKKVIMSNFVQKVV
jgi:DNA helicase-2/ATP-dependent DNA helicase PcrA